MKSWGRSMRDLTVLPVLVCIAAFATAAAGTSPTSADARIYITHVKVVDTETGHEAQDRTVVISGDKIVEIRDSKNTTAHVDARVVDGSGKYLIPGLWDMHVHGTDDESTLGLYVANGVTGVREMFGPPDANRFRSKLAAKHIVAPHIYLGSPIVDGNPPVWPKSIVVETPEQGRNAVDAQKQSGADFIKVYSRLSREAYFAILAEAKRQNIPVEGHVPIRITTWEATAAGQKSIEHLMGIGFACSSREKDLWPNAATTKTMLASDTLEVEAWRTYSHEKCKRLFLEFKKNGSWPVPTLSVYRTFGLLDDSQFRNDRRLSYFSGEFRDWLAAKDDPRLASWTPADFQLERELFRYEEKAVGELFRGGVPMLAGTDTGNPFCFPGFSLHDELALLVEAGMSPLGALQAATRNAALFMDASDRYGSIAVGKMADLVLLDADPLQDIRNTSKISEVFVRGQEFDRTALDQILNTAAELAAKAPAKN